MAHKLFWALLLTAVVVSAPSTRADYGAGQRAWDEGRPGAALTELRSAAASGDRRAMLALGRRFIQGLGAPQDYVEAHKWLNLAASRGEAAALRERDALAAKMTAEQVATAQARAAAWRPAGAGTADPDAIPAVPKDAPAVERASAQAAVVADSPPASPPSKEANREAAAPTRASGGSSQAAASPSTSSTGGFFPAMAELAIQGSQVYRLFKLMEEDPEKFADVARTVAQDLQKRMKGAAPAVSLKSKCPGAAKGRPRWKDVANRPGCRVWVDCYVPDQIVTWSGTCSGGFADGQGTLESFKGEEKHTGTGTGTFSNGKAHGRWVLRHASGQVEEGPFVDGKRHGRWVVPFAEGTVGRGPFVDGEMLGRWVLRDANGVAEGPLVDGKPHGRWVVRHRDGKVTETMYVDGVPR